jgi:hypothetical protein
LAENCCVRSSEGVTSTGGVTGKTADARVGAGLLALTVDGACPLSRKCLSKRPGN